MTVAPELIGRDRPAELLRAQLRRAFQRHGGLVLVTGEAGIGKTSLVAEAMHEARADGAVVANGACWDHAGAPGYWPWLQIVRGLRREARPLDWACASEVAGDDLSFLLGEMSEPPAADEAAEAAFRLYDAVLTTLATVSRSRPVVVTLDDLHRADPASLRLLDFVVRHAWFERLLIVGTYRDVEVEPIGHPLEPLILPLLTNATTVTLTGLDADDVGALLTRTTGRDPGPDLAAEVHRRTGGNPFFVEQVARLWHSGSPVDAVPPGIRDAVERRLAQLPEPMLAVLTAAAVLGPQFHRDVLAAASARPTTEVNRILRQAAMARLVVPLDDGRFGFAHDLVRETLDTSLDETVRRRHHAAVVRAVDDSPTLAGHTGPADIAHHAYLAVPDVRPTDAVRHLLAAAGEASCRLAAEEASGHYQRALELIPADDPQRASVARDLKAARRRAGDLLPTASRPNGGGSTAPGLDGPVPTGGPARGDGATAPGRSADGNVFRFDGAVWALAFGGRTAHLPDAKGLRDLHVLLERPGTDVPAVELLAPDGGETVRAARRMGGDPVLDETAKAQYRERLSRLDEEIDRATHRYDDARAAELDEERDALIDELRRAAGLAGRTRRLGDEAERARKAVTGRIRDALRRLDGHHPELAGHLRASVSTGTTCRYLPAAPVTWEL